MSWYVDQTRYIKGFACPFARALAFHAHGTGMVPASQPIEIKLGLAIHDGLERLYTHFNNKSTVTREEVATALQGVVKVTDWDDLIVGMCHAYARAVLPWILAQYDVVSIEEEFSVALPGGIVWMARPDVLLRNRASGTLEIVEFKSTSARPERIAAIHSRSLQTIMNAHAVAVKYKEPCTAVQIHVLQRGNEEYRSYLTHAYFRVGQPPFTVDGWEPKSKRKDGSYIGKLFRKVRVSDYRPVDEWVWEMGSEWCQDACPIILNPLGAVHAQKSQQAVASIARSETEWRQYIEFINWEHETHATLCTKIPRTFQCIQYERACEYEPICFGVPLDQPIPHPNKLEAYTQRVPHHPQEIKK